MRKKQSLILAELYKELIPVNPYYKNKYKKTKDCGNYLEFLEKVNSKGKIVEKKLYQAYFCKGRLCPMCNWRRSLKLCSQLNDIITVARTEEPKLRYLFLTLTSKNVEGENLEDEINKLNKSFAKLKRRKEVKAVVEGYFKVVEVTYNSDEDTYNPHLHILLAVRSTYFNRNYIKQDRWTKLWQQSLKVNYKPMVNIQAVKNKDKLQKSDLVEDVKAYNQAMMSKAIKEVGKYAVKLDDFIKPDIDIKVIDTLEFSLKNKRLATFGGYLLEIQKRLNLKDVEDDRDLIKINKDDFDDKIKGNIISTIYRWNNKKNDYFS